MAIATIPYPQVIAPSAATNTHAHSMPFGAEIQPNGNVRFRLYGPAAQAVSLELDTQAQPLPMHRTPAGWHELTTPLAQTGTRYSFILPDGLHVPDPASRFQPEDLHGPSEVVDPAAFTWQDSGWRGLPWPEAVLYELHIGAFTPQGTFLAAIEKLDHLASLGITVIEIMPVADFPGTRNRGYDGALLYAPDSSYGRPEDLKALVQAAHARGIAVLLDVVYNHFGPDGNYIASYFPDLLTQKHKTNWGDAVNYDGDNNLQTRELIIHNAIYWVEEFHLDGLRLDAVHAIMDDSPNHILDELATRVRATVTAGPSPRPIHLILENENNQAERLTCDELRHPSKFTAQWNDDMHHVLHTAATHEVAGYYENYKGDPEKLGRALAQGFAFQGQLTVKGEPRGEPSAHLNPGAFVSFIQNHDQIGNRAFGDRINSIVGPQAVRALAAVYLLMPQTPMLFMGEEWSATQPFPYFCDFTGELGDKVREGRRKEFASFPEFQDPAKRESIPDPQADQTFLSAKLNWDELRNPGSRQWVDWYCNILACRRQSLPIYARIGGFAGSWQILADGALIVRWSLDDGGELQLAANLTEKSQPNFPPPAAHTIWQEGHFTGSGEAAPWSVRWSVQA